MTDPRPMETWDIELTDFAETVVRVTIPADWDTHGAAVMANALHYLADPAMRSTAAPVPVCRRVLNTDTLTPMFLSDEEVVTPTNQTRDGLVQWEMVPVETRETALTVSSGSAVEGVLAKLDALASAGDRREARLTLFSEIAYRYWVARTGRKNSKLTTEREKILKTRLKDEGVTEMAMVGQLSLICHAIDGISKSSFHTGDNAEGILYNDLTLICRHGSHLEKFASASKAGRDGAPHPFVTESLAAIAADSAP